MTPIYTDNFYRPRSADEPSIRVEVYLDEPDRTHQPPHWPFRVEVKARKGFDSLMLDRAVGGTLEAMNEELLGEMLAEKLK